MNRDHITNCVHSTGARARSHATNQIIFGKHYAGFTYKTLKQTRQKTQQLIDLCSMI